MASGGGEREGVTPYHPTHYPLMSLCSTVFTIKVWVRQNPSSTTSPSHSVTSSKAMRGPGESGGEELERDATLVFEKTFDLSDLVYLGTLVCVVA